MSLSHNIMERLENILHRLASHGDQIGVSNPLASRWRIRRAHRQPDHLAMLDVISRA